MQKDKIYEALCKQVACEAKGVREKAESLERRAVKLRAKLVYLDKAASDSPEVEAKVLAVLAQLRAIAPTLAPYSGGVATYLKDEKGIYSGSLWINSRGVQAVLWKRGTKVLDVSYCKSLKVRDTRLDAVLRE